MPLSTKTFLIFSNLNSRISYLSFHFAHLS